MAHQFRKNECWSTRIQELRKLENDRARVQVRSARTGEVEEDYRRKCQLGSTGPACNTRASKRCGPKKQVASARSVTQKEKRQQL